MRDILLTSSALILALLVLRRIFRDRISRRLQYALWALVLLRLLLPAHLPAAGFSLLSAAAPAIEAADGQAFLPQTMLRLLWHGGMAFMALWLAISNLLFWLKLRRGRLPLELPDCKRPVYLVEEGLASPCLFGLIRPAVYLTPAALRSEEDLRHVLAHEETHARHLDPLWSLLRGVCLTVYWFDPLVWWAAAASREDCELACDEGALRLLDESERISYGRTLLRLIPVRRSMGSVLVTATTMSSDKKRLQERITRIAEDRRMKIASLCAVLAVTAAVCAVTFTGRAAAVDTAQPQELPQELPLPVYTSIQTEDRSVGTDHHTDHHSSHHGS